MKNLKSVQNKINEIKKYNGLDLILTEFKPKKTKGLTFFEVEINTNFQSMDMYKLESLVKTNHIKSVQQSGKNKMYVYF